MARRTDTPAPSTLRWRRLQERLPTGEVIVAVPIDHAMIELMLDAGEIDDVGSRDRKTLASAIRRIAANALVTKRRA